MGSEEDPEDGKAVARTVFGAVLVYAVGASLSTCLLVVVRRKCGGDRERGRGRMDWKMPGWEMD